MEIEGDTCKYKDFIYAKPPSIFGIRTRVEAIDRILEMEMVFKSRNSSNLQKNVLAVEQLKTGVLSWWKLLADSMLKGDARKMSWEIFLEELKKE